MTIDELIARLHEYRDELGGDAEVRLMNQPSWPFETEIAGLITPREISETAEDEDDFDPQGDNETVVYIVEGQQLGYGTIAAWNACY